MSKEKIIIYIDDHVTDFLDKHPGGKEVLQKFNKKDATEAFNSISGHRDTHVLGLLDKFCIGPVSRAEPDPILNQRVYVVTAFEKQNTCYRPRCVGVFNSKDIALRAIVDHCDIKEIEGVLFESNKQRVIIDTLFEDVPNVSRTGWGTKEPTMEELIGYIDAEIDSRGQYSHDYEYAIESVLR